MDNELSDRESTAPGEGKLLPWHRIFGMAMTDLFLESPYDVEIEKDLSVKQQFLDIVILRKTPGDLTIPLPDGLDGLADHNLITYKSLHEPLDAFAIDELMAHLVNYRKQLGAGKKKILPVGSFRVYAICTRFPKKLSNEVKLEKVQPGVYETQWGIHRVRILVLKEMPDKPENAIWGIFSAVWSKVDAGRKQYQPHGSEFSTVMNALFERYELEGIYVPYTIEDFRRDYVRTHLNWLTPEERLRDLPPEERLRGLPPEERLRGLTLEELEEYIHQRKAQSNLPQKPD